MIRSLLLAALLVASASAQVPFFEASRVQIPNSDDTTPLGPGELISIYGSDLGPDQPCQGQADPDLRETPDPQWRDPRWINLMVFPKELCGVRVLVGGEPAGLLYVHRDQINFKVSQSVPMEGTVGLQIIHGDQASMVVQVEAGLAPLRLILPERAFTNMPIWVGVVIPPNRGAYIEYPYSGGPGDIGCNELLVRKDGQLLKNIPTTRFGGGVSSGNICGSSSSGDGYDNRLPLHLVHRIEEPGDYEVRLNMSNRPVWDRALTDEEIFIQSDWTPLKVEASRPGQRRTWLDAITREPPIAGPDVIADYLPSILGVPDEQSLEAVVEQFYHLHSGVKWYAQHSLDYWPLPEALAAVERTFKLRGPSVTAVNWLLAQRTNGVDPLAVVERSLPYLRSSDPAVLRGAVSAVYSLGWLGVLDERPDMRSKAASAMIAAERFVRASGDYETSQDYTQSLGMLGEERAVPILWRLADEGIALGASLVALAHIAQPEDLPKLAAFLDLKNMPRGYYYQVHTLLGSIASAYGAEAILYVERIIEGTDDLSLRDGAGSFLVSVDLPEAWAFIAKAIENDAAYKADLMRYIGAHYPGANATQASMLALAKRRAAGLKP